MVVSALGLDGSDKGKQRARFLRQRPAGTMTLDVGPVWLDQQSPPNGVNQRVALEAIDLPGVTATWPAGFLGLTLRL